MNREYSSKEIAFLFDLKERIIKKHKKCGGVGYFDSDRPCDCLKIFRYLREIYYARIPMDYWTLSLEKLEVDSSYKKIVGDYIQNIDNAIEQGLGILFLGERGIGKTSLMCEIGKAAIIKRYDVYYNFVQNVVNDHFSDEKLILHRIRNSDIVLLDELDKVMMRENSNIPKQIDTFLRELLANKKAIIISTNLKDEEEVEQKYGLGSLMQRYIKPVQMEGVDFSPKKQEEWMAKLKADQVNFITDSVIRSAREFYQYEDRANAKEFDSTF